MTDDRTCSQLWIYWLIQQGGPSPASGLPGCHFKTKLFDVVWAVFTTNQQTPTSAQKQKKSETEKSETARRSLKCKRPWHPIAPSHEAHTQVMLSVSPKPNLKQSTQKHLLLVWFGGP